jgi:hypothetical protein
MVTKSGVGVRFTCSDVAGRYGGNSIHQLEIHLNNKLEYILQFSWIFLFAKLEKKDLTYCHLRNKLTA